MMTPEQKQILRQTWARVVPIGDTAATIFYARVFAIDPSIKSMFSTADLAAQRHKLLKALNFVVNNLDDLETLLPMLEQLGRRHAGYGVRDTHYDSVGAALLWTLQQGLGNSWTAEVEAAWSEAYTMVTNVMRHATVDVASYIDAPVTVQAVADASVH